MRKANLIKIFLLCISVPVVMGAIFFFLAKGCEKWQDPLIAAGTIGAVVAAVWILFYRDAKAFLDQPKLEMGEPGFKPQFYRQAPEIKINLVKDKNDEPRIQYVQEGMGYYINILLKNIGKRTAKNCQPLVTSMWKLINGKWEKEENWISVPLRWAAGEEYENIKDLKLREERNLIPHRPYYFNLGQISTRYPQKFRILDLPGLTAQPSELDPGEYYFEVTVTGEEVERIVKYFKVRWDGECSEDLNEVKKRFFVSMHNSPPSKNG
jgi:hypothetical protein